MKLLCCITSIALAVLSPVVAAQETGVRARHMLAIGDEYLLLTHGALRSGFQPAEPSPQLLSTMDHT
ncbi:hypothetical protein Plhal304r1_c039g0116681 [Plasmopara halstedii]